MRLISIIAVLLVAPACFGPHSAIPYEDDETATGGWVDQWADAVCSWSVRCDPGEAERRTIAACKALVVTERDWRTTTMDDVSSAFASVTAGRATFDQTVFKACLSRLRNAGCDVDVRGDFCLDAFHGTGAPGTSCVSSAVCQEGSVCAAEGDCAGACQTLSSGQCLRHSDCEAGRSCVRGRCQTDAPAGLDGRPCGVPVECAPSHLCVGGTCRRQQGANEGCNTSSLFCADGLRCIFDPYASYDPYSQGGRSRCKPFVAAGGHCDGVADCEIGLICQRNARTCRVPPARGACLDIYGTRDPYGSWNPYGGFNPSGACDQRVAFCDGDKKCQPLRKHGEPCGTVAQCSADQGPVECSGGLCTAVQIQPCPVP